MADSFLDRLKSLPPSNAGGTIRWRDRLPQDKRADYDKVLAELRGKPKTEWPDRKSLLDFIAKEFGKPITINTLKSDVERE